ncbi:hypothetical protein AB0I49_20935 [Streptomyces sp. NPDC050617]|uniref:hypothetical protein n=1 Tax=Streptomyces sp. NPDC050617 TaxID=3154628 RepID=UPI0034454EAB
MTRRVVSFAWGRGRGRGLGHVSRLIAVHTELRSHGLDSLLLTERHQRLIDDHGLRQTVIPTDADSRRARDPRRERSLRHRPRPARGRHGSWRNTRTWVW